MATRSLGDAVMRARLDKSGLTTGLNSAKTETSQTLDQIDRRWEQTGKKIEGIGKGLTLGLTLPLTALGGLSLKAASDAEETASKFATVFRDVGDEAERAAVRMADSYGLSSRASKQLLGDTGDLLSGFGFTGDAALDMSVQVNELAVDLASFTNYAGGAEGASAALTKGLLGEREAMKSLGIAIGEADVKAQLLLNKQEGLTFASERQAKAYATLQIAQRQSGNAMGDFARTSDEFANQTRILRANLDDLLVTLGEGILPIATPIVSGLADMAAAFAGMSEETRTFILVTGLAAAATGPLLIGLGRIVAIAPKVVAGLRTIRTAMLFMGPGGLIAGGIGLVLGLGAAFLATRDDANEAADALDDARDAIGTASDKDALAGALDDLSGNLRGDAKRALQEYAAEVRTATGDLKTMKREAANLINEVANAPLIAERNALEAQLQGLSNLEGATNDPGSAQRRLAALSEQQQELAASSSPDDRMAAVAMNHELNMLRSAIRNGEEHNGQVEYVIERRRSLQTELANVNAQIAANLQGTGTTDGSTGDSGASGASGDAPTYTGPSGDKPPAPVGSLARAQENLANERERFEFATTDVVREQSAERIRVLQGEIDSMRAILKEAESPATVLASWARPAGGRTTAPASEGYASFLEDRAASQGRRPGVLGFLGSGGRPTDGSLSVSELRVNRMRLDERLAVDAIIDFARGGPTDRSVDAAELTRNAADLQRARQDAAIFSQLPTGFDPRRGSLYGEAGVNIGGVERARQDAVLDQLGRSMDQPATDLSTSASELRSAAAVLTLTGQQNAVVAAAWGPGGMPKDFRGGQYGERGSQVGTQLTNDQAAFGAAAGDLSLDLGRRADRGDGGLAEANQIAKTQQRAAEDFQSTVIAAGAGFAKDLATAIQTGDIGGAVESLVGAGGSIVSSLAGMWGPLVSAGFSIFGSLLGGLFGGGQDQAETNRHERENRERRHVPTLHINFSVQQTNTYEGGPQMPQVEQAYRRQASIVVEEFMKRTRIPQRLAALEGGAA